MPRPWETLDARVVLDGSPWMVVRAEKVRLPSGREVAPFYTYRKSDFAVVFAMTEDAKVLVQRRYRHGPRRVTLDFPAGYVDAGEAPLEAARRELREETGYEAASWTSFGATWTDGNGGGSLCHPFLAQLARRVGEPVEDDTEEADVLLLGVPEVRAALERGEFATLPAAAMASRGLLHVAGRTG